MPITHVFFDIGGVLGTNGWDREQRQRAAERFGLDDEFERLHEELIGEWETDAISLEEYLDVAVFYRERAFSREAFVRFMRAQSVPDARAIALVRRLAEGGRATLMTLNNEPAALNAYRIETFGLRDLFVAFLSSCWLGVRKPSPRFFHRALAIAQVEGANALFVDDREQNLTPAHALGMRTILYREPGQLERELVAAGVLTP